MPNHVDKGLGKRFVLPFATPAANRLKEFTKDMEMAAILYIAESKREKGESLVLKKTDEKLVFLTEVCYPIWLIPYNGATLMFDGLGVTSHILSYDAIPDVEVFNKNIRENRDTTEAYTATLDRNTEYFGSFNGKEEVKIEGLITISRLIDDFKAYLPQMKKIERQFTTKAVLAATIEDCEIQAGIEHLVSLRKRANREIESIGESMKLLNETTVQRIKAIRGEIRRVQKKYSLRIEKIKPKVKRKLWQIHSKYDLRIARKSERFKKRLQRLHENRIKLQRTLRHLKTEAKRCKTRMRSSRNRKEAQWTLKLKRIKKKLPTLRKRIKANIKRMQNVEVALNLELAVQKTECDKRIEVANKIFLDLQASRDAEITMKRREIATLEDLTNRITSSMREMVQIKRVFLREFDIITMPGEKRSRGLVYVPFYLARYEKGDKKRYVVYPPSLVGDMGILTKMKGALGVAKLNALFQSRSKAMATFLNQVVELIENNPMLEKDITEAGIQTSILLKKRLRVGVKEGLKELENQNWISEKEFQAFSRLLYIYTSAV
jgi:hypothetical protein